MKIQIVFACIITIVFACGNVGDKNPTEIKTASASASTTPQDDPFAESRKKYNQLCTACHGKDGKLAINGAKKFSESVLKLEERIEVITNGQGMMMAFKGMLKPEEIKGLAKYTIHLGEKDKE